MSLLEVKDLEVKFKTNDGLVSAVNKINFSRTYALMTA